MGRVFFRIFLSGFPGFCLRVINVRYFGLRKCIFYRLSYFWGANTVDRRIPAPYPPRSDSGISRPPMRRTRLAAWGPVATLGPGHRTVLIDPSTPRTITEGQQGCLGRVTGWEGESPTRLSYFPGLFCTHDSDSESN